MLKMFVKVTLIMFFLASSIEVQLKTGHHVNEHGSPPIYLNHAGTGSSTTVTSEDSYIIEKGTSLTLNCASGHGKDVFLWHKHKSHPTYQVSPGDDNFLQSGHMFYIVNASSVHDGAYFCYTAAVDGKQKAHKWKVADINVVSEFSITTSPPTSSPRPKDPLEDRQPLIYFNLKSPVYLPQSLPTTLTLTPTVTGLAPTMLNWLRDSEVVSQSARLKVSGDNGQRLEINPPFTEDDSGFFELKACNKNGCQSRGIQILFYSIQQQVTAQKQVSKKGEWPAIIGGTVSGILIYCLIMIVLKKKGIIFRNLGKEIEDGTKDISEQMKRGFKGKSSFLWSWKQQSQLDKQLSKEFAEKQKEIASMKSSVAKDLGNANGDKKTDSDRTKGADEPEDTQAAPTSRSEPRPRAATPPQSTPVEISQIYDVLPHSDIYATHAAIQHAVGPATAIYGTYGQHQDLLVGGDATDIYGTVHPQVTGGMGMNIYGTYGAPAFGSYEMHAGYGYGPSEEDHYGDVSAIYGSHVQQQAVPSPESAIYGSGIPPPPVPPPIGNAQQIASPSETPGEHTKGAE